MLEIYVYLTIPVCQIDNFVYEIANFQDVELCYSATTYNNSSSVIVHRVALHDATVIIFRMQPTFIHFVRGL